ARDGLAALLEATVVALATRARREAIEHGWQRLRAPALLHARALLQACVRIRRAAAALIALRVGFAERVPLAAEVAAARRTAATAAAGERQERRQRPRSARKPHPVQDRSPARAGSSAGTLTDRCPFAGRRSFQTADSRLA